MMHSTDFGSTFTAVPSLGPMSVLYVSDSTASRGYGSCHVVAMLVELHVISEP